MFEQAETHFNWCHRKNGAIISIIQKLQVCYLCIIIVMTHISLAVVVVKVPTIQGHSAQKKWEKKSKKKQKSL